MIIIEFKEGQGLGNQLWYYSSAKSIADKLNYELVIQNYHLFKGKKFLKIEFDSIWDDIQDKKEYTIFNEKIYYDYELKYVISDFDQNVLNISKNTKLEGLYQSEKYFFGDLAKLKKYIELDPKIINSTNVDKKICILNIRGGEYKRHKKFMLRKKYWENAMNNFKNISSVNDFLIVTDDFKYAKSLFPNLEIIHGDIQKCYATIFNCSNIIVSNSTFSYFPCTTGLEKKIIAPMYWARPIVNNGRWISPANIYKDWIYQDKNYKLKTYSECLKIALDTSNYYSKNYNILVNKKDIPKTGVLNFLTKKQKKIIKNILGFIWPRIF
jgi:hypothetical protein